MVAIGDARNLFGSHIPDGLGICEQIVDFDPRVLAWLPGEDALDD
jgi:hypothetical protein